MNNKYKILVVEDEENINNLITTLLDANGYQALSAKSCADARIMNSSYKPDLVILDLGLPDADGGIFLKEVRKGSRVPIIVLSARSDEKDKVEALDSGANDYVTKPFGAAELVARVRSALRTSVYTGDNAGYSGERFETGDLSIDYDSRRVFIEKNEINLTQTEYNIIAFLSKHPGKVLTYAAIIKEIWGYSDLGSIKKLQVNMANIRKKFGAIPGKKNYIINELGVGYRMNNDE